MKKVFEAKIELPVKFSSGNQIQQGRGRIYRSKQYHTYHDYLKASLEDVLDEVRPKLNLGCAYRLRTLFVYPVPKSLVASKKKRDEFNSTSVLPITRGTIDLDNSAKGTNDVLQEVLGFDDSQIVSEELHKRYWLGDMYVLKIELYEIPSGMEIDFYD